jgi:transposase
MNCPKCNSDKKVRNGIVRGIQRYMCKNCNNNYTVAQKATAVDKKLKRLALILYLQGTSVSAIARLIDVSHVSVGRWINQYGSCLSELVNSKSTRVDPAVYMGKDIIPIPASNVRT